MLAKIRNSKLGKYVVTAMIAASIAAMGCLSAFATDGETSVDLSGTLTTAFTTMKNDILGYIAVILPIALAVVGAFFGIKKAIAFFKSTAGKGN